MKRPLHAIALASLGLVSLTLPALARPEIASGDQLLTTDVEGCLTRADRLIANLGVQFDQGGIDRTGYFEDGAFRILCYGAGDDSSLAVVFATHEQSADVAASFIQMMLGELSQAETISQQ
ncbi:hypothetical protein [Nodosilinea sp. E11]|uniref:hypothetical protein n=1 Tax=Nodosilinea sp. E11 TaxID=3037479 RepID=UPI0029351716|nr:hypothetical protein [Nodosilinea sp. E11]WOD37780.1 hypothetical protein RRF56_16335 [Nodosilinea sp. E11]